MRKSFLISLFFLSAVSSYSQNKNKEKDSQGGGTIAFKETLHNFGKIEEEKGQVTYGFSFVNSGKGPLRIKNVLTSCGCTTPEWTHEVINPGEIGMVKATFEPKNRPGLFSRTLTVITDGVPEQVVLTLEGEVLSVNNALYSMFPSVIGHLRFSAKELSIRELKEDKIDTLWLGILNTAKEGITIRNVITPLPVHFESRMIYLLPDQGDNIMLTYNAALMKDLGLKVHEIKLLTTDDSVSTKVIPLKVNIVQNFDKLTPEQRQNAPVVSVDKTEADAGELYLGETGKYTFTITNKGQSDLVIRKIYGKSNAVSGTIANPVIKKGKTGKLVASLKTKGLHGKVEDQLYIIVNDPKQPNIALKLKAKVVIPGIETITN